MCIEIASIIKILNTVPGYALKLPFVYIKQILNESTVRATIQP